MSAVDALQETLAGEHAAVYVYGVLGGRVSVSASPDLARELRTAYTTHRGRRDQLIAMIRAAEEQPVAARVSYELPSPARNDLQCRRAAAETESRCAEVYAAMVGTTSRANRQWAIDALTDAAVRHLTFGGDAAAFPGVPEL
jgi:glutamate/tyrosine decarboxylase-like PLP-dependent enzyme